ncbi:hypothetical protein [Nocardia speluncae]|nr:hypothetical protein [Nocardia speluncae]
MDIVGAPVLPEVLPHLRDGARWVVAGAIGGHTVSLGKIVVHP